MRRHLQHALMLGFLITGPAWADACSLNAAQQIRTLVPDCAVLSAFEASFGRGGLFPESIVLQGRRVDFRFHNPTNRYEYDVFLADDEVARELTGDDQAFVAVRIDFETALVKHVCQISGAADAVRGGTVFDFSILFRLNGEAEAAVSPWGARKANVFIHTCEAP